MGEKSEHEVYDTPLLYCWRGSEGIVYLRSKEGDRTIENYQIVFDMYNELSENGSKKFCLFCDIASVTPLAPDVRKYVEEHMPTHVKAVALVSNSEAGTATGTLFRDLSHIPYPISIFSDGDEALAWLRLHL